MKIIVILLVTIFQLHAIDQPSLQVIQNMSFGSLLVLPAGGRITLTEQGSRIPVGTLMLGANSVGSYARIRLRGPAGSSFILALDAKNPVLAGSAGGSIQVASFQASLPTLAGKFDNSGETEVTLGGTLDVPADIPDGSFHNVVNLILIVERLPSVTQSMTVSCIVRTPLTLTNLSPLDFASITSGGGGIFNVLPTSAFTKNGNGPRLVKGSPKAASFRITGPPSTFYNIILPEEAILTGPKGTLRISDFTSDQVRGSLPSGGIVFHVGARLNVIADQAPGTYKGIFRVTVAYN